MMLYTMLKGLEAASNAATALSYGPLVFTERSRLSLAAKDIIQALLRLVDVVGNSILSPGQDSLGSPCGPWSATPNMFRWQGSDLCCHMSLKHLRIV